MSNSDDLYGELDAQDASETRPSRADNSDYELFQQESDIKDDATRSASNRAPTSENQHAESSVDSQANNWDLGPSARCFVLKPDSYGDIEASFQSNEIYPPQHVQHSISNARKDGDVVLVFSVSNSRAFQGYAQVSTNDAIKSDSMGIKICWQRLCSLPHASTVSILNKYNGNQPIKTSRDGQELERTAAVALIKQIRQEPEVSLESLREILQEFEGNSHGPYSQSRGRDTEGDRKRLRDDDQPSSYQPGAHPALFGLDLKNMTYEEYLEQYNLRKSLAFDKFHAQLAATVAAGGPGLPMGMMMPGHMGMGMGMGMPPGQGFYPGGPGHMGPGHFGMGPGMYPPPHMYGGRGFNGGPPMGAVHGRYGGGRGRGGRF